MNGPTSHFSSMDSDGELRWLAAALKRPIATAEELWSEINELEGLNADPVIPGDPRGAPEAVRSPRDMELLAEAFTAAPKGARTRLLHAAGRAFAGRAVALGPASAQAAFDAYEACGRHRALAWALEPVPRLIASRFGWDAATRARPVRLADAKPSSKLWKDWDFDAARGAAEAAAFAAELGPSTFKSFEASFRAALACASDFPAHLRRQLCATCAGFCSEARTAAAYGRLSALFSETLAAMAPGHASAAYCLGLAVSAPGFEAARRAGRRRWLKAAQSAGLEKAKLQSLPFDPYPNGTRELVQEFESVFGPLPEPLWVDAVARLFGQGSLTCAYEATIVALARFGGLETPLLAGVVPENALAKICSDFESPRSRGRYDRMLESVAGLARSVWDARKASGAKLDRRRLSAAAKSSPAWLSIWENLELLDACEARPPQPRSSQAL